MQPAKALAAPFAKNSIIKPRAETNDEIPAWQRRNLIEKIGDRPRIRIDALPWSVPYCFTALVSINDVADRPARALADGETLALGGHALKWLDMPHLPHLPHGWETGYLMESATATLLCGDLFTQGGMGTAALTTDDILEPSEAFRRPMDYFAHAANTAALLEKLASEAPTILACMHAWQGDGAALLRALGLRLMDA